MKCLLVSLAFLAACSKGGVIQGDSDPSGSETGPSSQQDSSEEDSALSSDSQTGDSQSPSGLPEPEGDPATVELSGSCDLAEKWGSFAVEAQPSYTAVYGSVSNGVVPVTILEEVSSQEGCQLMKRNNPFCDPPCEADETCDFDGECIPYPETQDLGTVTIAGLVADVIMEPVSPGYTYFESSLSHPGFAADQLIELRTGGGAYGEVVLHGVGFTPLELAGGDWLVIEGEDLPLQWTPSSDSSGRATIFATLNIDQHGVSPTTAWCAFEDTGSASIPASVVDALFSAGVTGYPSGTLSRRTVDSASIGDGCVDFTVSSPHTTNVSVYGHTPCERDSDCPPDQVCDIPTGTCVDP